MKENVFIVYRCNAWKEYTSMQADFVGTSFEKMILHLKKGVESGEYECGNDEIFKFHTQPHFTGGFKWRENSSIYALNSILSYCHIQKWQNGEQVA